MKLLISTQNPYKTARQGWKLCLPPNILDVYHLDLFFKKRAVKSIEKIPER